MTDQTKNKSFILHIDSLEVLDQLSDDQAGKLFKAIFSYQKTGETGEIDKLLKIAITPFLNQFKRDEESYNNSVIQGKIGNLKKYHGEIYLKLMNGDLTLKEAENLAYPHKKVIHRPPIIPDQVGSLSDNDSVSDSINIKKEISKDISKKSLFKKPLLKEVIEYCLERKNTVNAEKFYNYYEANGWKVGKNPMKDWKAAVRTWEISNYANKKSIHNNFQEQDYSKGTEGFEVC